MNHRIFRPEQYGAKADGTTDDSKAIEHTIYYASQSNGVVQLAKNSTYYLKGQNNIALTIKNTANITIKGENTKILTDTPNCYCKIENTENVHIEGITFDCLNKMFIRANILSVDKIKTSADIVVEEKGKVLINKYNNTFAMLTDNTGKLYFRLGISNLAVIDRASNTYRVFFDDISNDDVEMIKNVAIIEKAEIFITENAIEIDENKNAFLIRNSSNISIKSCNIHYACGRVFNIFSNEDTILFENVSIAPNLESNYPFVSMYEGFFVKNNRAKITWNNCAVDGVYGDAINIGSSLLHVDKMYTVDDVELKWFGKNSIIPQFLIGDDITFIDYNNGELLGTTSIRKVVSQKTNKIRLLLEDPLLRMSYGVNICAFIYSLASEGSVIKNSKFFGDFQLRGPITIKDSFFSIDELSSQVRHFV